DEDERPQRGYLYARLHVASHHDDIVQRHVLVCTDLQRWRRRDTPRVHHLYRNDPPFIKKSTNVHVAVRVVTQLNRPARVTADFRHDGAHPAVRAVLLHRDLLRCALQQVCQVLELVSLPKVGGNIAQHRRRLSFSSLRVARVERKQLVDRAVGAIVLGEVPQRSVKEYTHDRHTDARTEPRGAQQLPPPLPAFVVFYPDSIGLLDRHDKAVVRQSVPTLAAGARLGAYEVLLLQNVNGGVRDRPFLTAGTFRPARAPGRNEIAIHPQTQAVFGHARFRCGSVERVFVEPLQRFIDVAIGLDVRGRNRVDIRGKIVPELRAGDLQLHGLDGRTNGLDVLAARLPAPRPFYRNRPQFCPEPLTRLGLDLSVGPREWSLDRLLGRFGAQFVEWKTRAQRLRQ